ncbi:MAG: helix-turn-helix domain-containing protein [Bacilli bacterium]|jgi:transcriptional regulator with XRE-family HTH domain|nr:helix-turn-helix domain-containing protein [Bacilli bacterium]
MTTGEKISIQRRKINLTQEQLADQLLVTRQTVSKWETDLAFPETDKLIAMSELFNCSIDYLLKENIEEATSVREEGLNRTKINGYINSIYFEYKSKKTIHGIPLVHVNWGFRRKAKGIIAIGVRAEGVIAIGIFAMGLLSFGVFSLGILAFGAWALGFIDLGAIAIGAFSFGAISIGLMSNGALSVGEFAYGALAIGQYGAVGNRAYGLVTSASTMDLSFGTYFKEASSAFRFSEAGKKALSEVVPEALKWLMNFFLSLYS